LKNIRILLSRKSGSSEGAEPILLSRKIRELGFLFLAFASATLIARLFGAGWGTAAGIGQIAFAAALVAVLLTPDRPTTK
jgi:hypothetical protein